MHMLVEDIDAWWSRIASLDLAKRYGVKAPSAPELQPWGLVVAYMGSVGRALAYRERPGRQRQLVVQSARSMSHYDPYRRSPGSVNKRNLRMCWTRVLRSCRAQKRGR
jgi:hypothetical protein